MELETRTYKIRLTSDMLGTVPKDPEIYKSYIETKKPVTETEDESQTVEKIEEKGWTGFHKDEHGLFIYNYMVLGFLKNAGEILKDQFRVTKEKKSGPVSEPLKAVRGKLDKFCFIAPRKIYLGKKDPDGVVERPLRAMTMQGPRVSLSRSDSVAEGTEFSFDVTLLKNKEIKWEMIDEFFSYGKFVGLGQFRNGSYGQFEVVS